MKTKLVTIIMLLCICLSGCSYEISETERLYNISSEKIYVDSETGVMYLWKTGYYKGGLSVMLNADGTPKVYKDTNTYNNVYNISSEEIYVDSETRVMYLWKTGYYKGGLSVMLNADGTPKVYKDTNTYKNVYNISSEEIYDVYNISSEEIYVDSETGVMYIWKTGYYKGGLSVMLNADGIPKVK